MEAGDARLRTRSFDWYTPTRHKPSSVGIKVLDKVLHMSMVLKFTFAIEPNRFDAFLQVEEIFSIPYTKILKRLSEFTIDFQAIRRLLFFY